ncbi:hypothetical protein SP5_110_00120 [Sphingomonas parapaucimobilis NBRC 15100]|uniref:Ribbon-helix-helix protein CopG domain-containing protein n=1 Tax=Sphingomonas parapaucimobilis NBRC 15100 TaxID=1219049 RepID=A0A0A1WDH3_9SPHN|nr:hypothetical protein SP5_110_00120 [Sphingomonas parapaucimobilis NBRC 15100]
MTSATGDTTKKKRPDQPGTPVMVRLQPAQLAALDAWRARQDPEPSRPEAIRALLAERLVD